jgi:hypothetical protein
VKGVRGEPDGGLRRRLHGALRHVHWQALELGTMGSGCPDTNGCWKGVEFWIECKQVSAENGLVPLEPGQVGWISRRCRAGGRAFVLTWVHHDGGVRKGERCSRLVLHEGWDAGVLRAEGVGAAPPVLVLESRWGTAREWDFDWEELLRILTEWTLSARQPA